MKYKVLALFLLFAFSPPETSFKIDQLKFGRVKSAYSHKQKYISELLKQKNISGPYQLFLRAFKEEGVLEAWISENESNYVLLKSYNICRASGVFGPKRQHGDFQVPEGVYNINRFNPQSLYYLSLGINYPNASDKILSTHSNLGGDIFIHGGCVTVGCLPITDDKIEEVYLLSIEARSTGQKSIPIHIFPKRMTDEGMKRLRETYKKKPDLIEFWENLSVVYQKFENEKKLHTVLIDKKGRYVVK